MEERVTSLSSSKRSMVYMKDLDNLQIMNETLTSLGLDIKKISLIDMQEVLESFETFIASAMDLKEKRGL